MRRSLALGPELAQCCGGRVEWRIETFDRATVDDLGAGDRPKAAARRRSGAAVGRTGGSSAGSGQAPAGEVLTAASPDEDGWTEPVGESARAVYLFGAGHVGRALALALAPLPFAVRWIDPGREAFPAYAPANVALIHAPEPAAELANAPDGALIVGHDPFPRARSRDRRRGARAERFGYVGLIGSATKRARFLSQMRAAGLPEARSRLICPIGLPGIEGKDPAVIAASTAAQLLMAGERRRRRRRTRRRARWNPSSIPSFQALRRHFLQLLIGLTRAHN